MANATTDSVAGILDIDPAIDLVPFIRTASVLVTWLVSVDTKNVLTSDLLTEIESYLAAHFYSHRDQLLQSKSTGAASGSFQGQTGMVLNSTQYGQTAMMLDVTGNLAKRSKEVEEGTVHSAKLIWMGTPVDSLRPCPPVDFNDR